MARGKPRPEDQEKGKGWAETFGFGQNWNNELCAEHDGTIASFDGLTQSLADIQDYGDLFKRKQYNLARTGKIMGGALGGALVFGPLVFLAAPAVAAALGSAGILGAASTGTAISSLSGAALTSASLAAIGGGTMATGMVVVTAVGAGLGAIQGGVVSNSYFGQVDGFKIQKLRAGKKPSVIFINGFLCESTDTCEDWQCSVDARFADHSQYLVQWESKTLRSLGQYIAKDSTGQALWTYVTTLAGRAAKKAGSKLNPVTWATIAADLISNPWHTAMVKAMMTGVMLADLLTRVEDTQFILMGHSLGCRVIYYALHALGTREKKKIQDVYLLGGAVDRNDTEGWSNACKGVVGNIHNCYSLNDDVLQYLYKPANAFLSDPIGCGAIVSSNDKIQNWNVSELVDGHMAYKSNLAKILRLIHA